MNKYYFIIPIIIALLGTLFFLFWPVPTASKLPSQSSQRLSSFAGCLREKGLVMYGVDTCGHCIDQKKIFGDAFREINYVNCDFDKSCEERNIPHYYPVWVYGNQQRIGFQPLNGLSQFSGCEL